MIALSEYPRDSFVNRSEPAVDLLRLGNEKGINLMR